MPAGRARPIGVGWMTVELDRVAFELARDLGLSPRDFVPASDSETLGTRCRVADAVLSGGLSLVLLEPATEGRSAATLARLGEGPWAVWFVADDDVIARASMARPGPFGPEWLLPGGPIHGPYRFLITSEPGTIPA